MVGVALQTFLTNGGCLKAFWSGLRLSDLERRCVNYDVKKSTSRGGVWVEKSRNSSLDSHSGKFP